MDGRQKGGMEGWMEGWMEGGMEGWREGWREEWREGWSSRAPHTWGPWDASVRPPPAQVDEEEMRKQQHEIAAIMKMREAASSGTQVGVWGVPLTPTPWSMGMGWDGDGIRRGWDGMGWDGIRMGWDGME